MWKVVQTDHLDSDAYLKSMEDNSVDAVVCDPPYELSFMGRRWDIARRHDTNQAVR